MSDRNYIDLDFGQLPVTWTVTDKKLGTGVTLFSILVSAPLLISIAGIDDTVAVLIVAIPCVLICGPLLLWGINLLCTREIYTITEDELTQDRKSLFSKKNWSKKLSTLTAANFKSISQSKNSKGRGRGPFITSYNTRLIYKTAGSEYEADLGTTKELSIAKQRLGQIGSQLNLKNVETRMMNYNLGEPEEDDSADFS